VRGMILSLDRSMPKVEGSRRRDHRRGKLTGVPRVAPDDVKLCEFVGYDPDGHYYNWFL
jgi:hypothetical protein